MDFTSEEYDQARAFIDDQLIVSYWNSVKHYGDQDLVLFVDVEEGKRRIFAHKRSTLLSNPEVEGDVKAQVQQTAQEFLKLKGPAFWLALTVSDEVTLFIAVFARHLATGGSA